nr:FkbM family methyltransferase [Azospirillum oleiclasticum]
MPWAAAFREAPIGLIDVGARWGPSEIFQAAPEVFDVLAFEPDPREADILEREIGPGGGWAGFRVHRGALGAGTGTGALHLLSKANNSSLLPVNRHFTSRYAFRGFELERVLEVPLRALDDVLAEDGHGSAAEIIKIDVQGAEIEILKGARRTLAERAVCVICEVAFFPFYEGMPLCADVVRFMTDAGFSLYGLLDAQNRSTKRLDKSRFRARERLCHADAVFLRDPLDHPDGLGSTAVRQAQVLMVAAILLGYLDLALELADAGALPEAERAPFADAIRRLAAVEPAAVVADAETLAARVRAAPADAMLETARMVDRLRDFQTVHDVPRRD